MRVHRYVKLTGRLVAMGLLVFAGLASVAGYFWRRGTIQAWMQKEVLKTYVQEIQPHLPFKIEHLEVHGGLRQFIRGDIPDVSMELLWGDYRIRLAGPMRIEHLVGRELLEVQYSPVATIEPAIRSGRIGEVSSPVALDLHAHASRGFKSFASLSLDAGAPDWKWPLENLSLTSPSVHAVWNGETIHLKVGAQSAHGEPAGHHLVELTDWNLEADTPMTPKPLKLGPEASATFSAARARLRIGKENAVDVDLPMRDIPIRGWVSLTANEEWKTKFPVEHFKLAIGEHLEHQLLADVALHSRGRTLQKADVRWFLAHFPVHEGKAFLTSSRILPSLEETLRPIELLAGELETHGTAEVRFPFEIEDVDGKVALRKFAFKLPRAELALSQVDLELPLSFARGGNGSIRAGHVLYKRLHGKLASTPIVIRPLRKVQRSDHDFSLNIGAVAIPLTINGVNLQLAPLQGTFALSPKFDYALETALKIPLLKLSDLASGICLEKTHLPPGGLVVDLAKIRLTPGEIQPTGRIRVEMFGGAVEFTDVEIFDLASEVPEFDFDARLDGVRLDELGAWTGFGEMDGLLHVRLKDVTLQAWLPTQWKAHIEVQPHLRNKVVFSAEAMHNFVKLFARDAIEEIPGIAKFLMFGWPHKLLGGYDVYYAGIDARSEEGQIEVRTIDDPEFKQGKARREDLKEIDTDQNHFILYGRWIRMPLKSSRYPLIVDARAMDDFVHYVIEYAESLAAQRDERLKAQRKLEGKKDVDENESLACTVPDPPL